MELFSETSLAFLVLDLVLQHLNIQTEQVTFVVVYNVGGLLIEEETNTLLFSACGHFLCKNLNTCHGRAYSATFAFPQIVLVSSFTMACLGFCHF